MIVFVPSHPTVAETEGDTPVITVMEAARRIAQPLDAPVSVILRKLINGLLSGELKARDQCGFTYKPDFVDVTTEKVAMADLVAYLERDNPGFQQALKRQTTVHMGDQFRSTRASPVQDAKAVAVLGRARVTRLQQQVERILLVLERLQLDPMLIPKGKKKVVKAECLEEPNWFTDASFDHAWKVASKARLISVKGREDYIKGRVARQVNSAPLTTAWYSS